MKIKLQSYITRKSEDKKKENKKLELSNSEIIYLIRFPSYVIRHFVQRAGAHSAPRQCLKILKTNCNVS